MEQLGSQLSNLRFASLGRHSPSRVVKKPDIPEIHTLCDASLLVTYNHQSLKEPVLVHCQNLISKILVSPAVGDHHNDTTRRFLCAHTKFLLDVEHFSIL